MMFLFLGAQAAPWQDEALDDLVFIHQALEQHHPGPVVDPHFRVELLLRVAATDARIRVAGDAEKARRELVRFVAGFQDGHLSLQVEDPTSAWPGFLVQRQGMAFVVTGSERPDVVNGAVVTGCDGRPVLELLDDEVIPSWKGVPGTYASQALAAPLLLVEGYTDTPLRTCQVAGRDVTLSWTPETQEAIVPRVVRAMGVGGAIDARSFDGTLWVRLPTFRPNADDEARLRKLLEVLPSYRNADRIVFDVRGNGGGSSLWGKRLVTALWGREGREDLWQPPLPSPDEPVAIHWRASPGNLTYFEGQLDRLSRTQGPAVAERARGMLDGLRGAVARNEPVWIEQHRIRRPTGTRSRPNPVTAEVVLLTDAHCASACLDFADELLGLPGVRHEGQPTSGDTRYMEVRSLPLPSGAGVLTFPQKAYVHRMRGHNEGYAPEVLYTGDGSVPDLLAHFAR